MSSSTQTTICKVCFDIGKSESEYTNHRVRDINGVVVCPTLLQIHCRYCDAVGHTVKYCSVRECDEKREQREHHRSVYQDKSNSKSNVDIPRKVVSSIYAVLQSDSSDDEELAKFTKVRKEKTKLKHKKPVLILTDEIVSTATATATATVTAHAPLTGWAAIAAKPSTKAAITKAKATTKTETTTVADIPNHARKVPQSVRKAMRSWADCSDTDSDGK